MKLDWYQSTKSLKVVFLLFPPTVSTVMRSVASESELVAAMTSEAAIEQLPPGTTLEGSKERLSVECRVDHVGCVDIEFKNNQASASFFFATGRANSCFMPSWQVRVFCRPWIWNLLRNLAQCNLGVGSSLSNVTDRFQSLRQSQEMTRL